MANIKEKCENLLIGTVQSFFSTSPETREKLYLKGLSEGMMKILKHAGILTSQEIETIVANAESAYETAISDVPTYKRLGRGDFIKSFLADDEEKT